MKKYSPKFAIVTATLFLALLCAQAMAAQARVLTSLAAISALTNREASAGLAVAFEGNVTYFRKGDIDLFVQDGDAAIYVEADKNTVVSPGDRVLVVGTTAGSFRPEIKAERVTVLHPGTMAPPVPATYDQLIRGEMDCRRVTVRATVHAVSVSSINGLNYVYLEMLMDGGYVDAQVARGEAPDLDKLIDAEVAVTGAAAGKFDSKLQMTGVLIEVPLLSDIKFLKGPAYDPAALPATPMDEVIKFSNIVDRSQRVRVNGSVTYYQPGAAVVLQDGSKSLWINTRSEKPLRIGDRASATGFPDVHNGSLLLTRGELSATGTHVPITPALVNPKELALGTRAFDLVSVEGRLLFSIRQSAQDEYVVVSGRHLFSAIYRHPERTSRLLLPAVSPAAVGSLVRITGICILDRGDQFQGPVAFNILLRSSDDVALLARPSPLTVRNLILLACLLMIAVLVFGIRGWAAERSLRHRTVALANLEQRRRRILEAINGSLPLADILQKIVELVCFKLKGAPCWCVLADGMQAGQRPALSPLLRVIECPIVPSAGPAHGTLFAAVDQRRKLDASDKEILSTAAGLAILAIETQRLHSDLRHRSEFDLLTDVHNRFSLERRLDALVESSRSSTSRFGLIYIDLDGFKQINDHYGHNTGDLYLQSAVARMKRQIRPGDMLARVGGDEFAVLVSNVQSVEEVKDIASRLEHCFDEPFHVDGTLLTGSGSFGVASYPADGTTKDSLLKAADTRMYIRKESKHRTPAGRAATPMK